MIALDEALAQVRRRCLALPVEEVPLRLAHGRTLARPVRALREQPAHDVSMMDGWALRAADARAPLAVLGEIAAGDAPWTAALREGQAARIFTGAPLPPGADCVVMQEHARSEDGLLFVSLAPKEGQHIRRRGEELRRDVVALQAGTVLRAAELSLCAACGAEVVQVHRRPRVGVLCTGSELVPLGKAPAPGQLVETNSYALAALAEEAGADVHLLGISPDDPEQIAAHLSFADVDVLITTGGASVGDHDHAQESFARLGGELVFHRVAIRPGKPILFGVAQRGALYFGLPGNPAAATLGFELFARLALRLLSGDPRPARPQARARLRGAVARVPGLTFFPRGRVLAEGAQLVFVPGGQQSSMQIASWVSSNAVAVVPPGEGKLDDGTEVDVLLTGPFD